MLNKNFLFCKNWLVVCTLSFNIRSNFIFSKKKMSNPLIPLTLKGIGACRAHKKSLLVK